MTKRRLTLLLVTALVMIGAGVFLQTRPLQAQEDAPDPHGEPGTFLQMYYEQWVTSPHANFEDDAFRHWDQDGEISERCATCHSTPGYRDFLGADGSEAGVVDAPAPLGTVVNCDACHSPAAANLSSVAFPSGVVINDIGDSTRCMVCHQGRNSGLDVRSAIADAGLEDAPNTVNEDFGFINIHYYAAASTLYGSEVHGGYEFEGMSYYMRNEHAPGYETCDDCHQPHTLELLVDDCATCHEGADSVEGVRNIRSFGSNVDYDGDGDMEEGIRGEIETLQVMLYDAILTYSAEVVGTPIVYADGYPYFFTDTNGNGEPDEDETNFGNSYASFTPRLLQATYNYQISLKDPGGYAHNPDYHLQLLVDSINAINGELNTDMDTVITREAGGHFEASAGAFRHWDDDGEVSARCSKCHTSEGLPFFAENGVTIAFEPSNSLSCETCHQGGYDDEDSLIRTDEVEFPSGAVVSFGEEEASNYCLNCHQGRQSTTQINAAISNASVEGDEVSEALSFQNPHYYASGGTLFGGEALAGYQYEGREYVGQFEHVRRFDDCTGCHTPHQLDLRIDECTECHEDATDIAGVRSIRFEDEDIDPVDYDGDGDTDEPVRDEIATLQADLFERVQAYAADVVGTGILYDAASYPYFFADTNGNGEADEGEISYGNQYNAWTPNLLRAAYNYKYATIDPGNYAHNADYMLQLLYDSLESMGGEEAVATYNRPPLRDDDD